MKQEKHIPEKLENLAYKISIAKSNGDQKELEKCLLEQQRLTAILDKKETTSRLKAVGVDDKFINEILRLESKIVKSWRETKSLFYELTELKKSLTPEQQAVYQQFNRDVDFIARNLS